MKSGRPLTELTKAQINEVEKLATNLNIAQIAGHFGMSERTFRRLKDRNVDVLTAYKKGKAKGIHNVAGALYEKASGGDVTCMIFYLKTQGGWSAKAATSLDLSDYVKEDEVLTQDRIKLISDRIVVDAFKANISVEDAQKYLDLLVRKANLDIHTHLAQDILDIKAGKYDPPHTKGKR